MSGILPIGGGGFGVIYADPPWAYKNWSVKGEGKGAAGQYSTLGIDELKRMPVSFCAAEDCALFMWATFPMIQEALELMKAWGFQYKTGASWHKKTVNGKLSFGTGYVFRGPAELLLVGVRGRVKWKSKSQRNAFEYQIRGHSRKPDELYKVIEGMADGPYLELFARQAAPNWTAWGNEKNKFEFEGLTDR